jgi:murein DD-endopeptidase MepM/ murein hydrolase activator NlpD
VQDFVAHWFPERHLYLRSGDQTHAILLSRRHQLVAVGVVAGVLVWTVFATLSLAAMALISNGHDNAMAKTTAYYERLNADRQARLQVAAAALGRASGSIEGMAKDIEKRHAALAWLLQDMKNGRGADLAQLKPVDPSELATKAPAAQIAAVRDDQARLLAQAETLARTRADRLRLAIKLAGLDPSGLTDRTNSAVGMGGPMIDEKDPRALAAILDVDEDFAVRIQHTARNLTDTRTLSDAAQRLPLSRPVASPMGTSTFGVRMDPFTRHAAFHAGQDFGGSIGSPIFSTAPGQVAFTGQRNGYGNVVEVDHGGGFKTRYAHLSSISVSVGQHVTLGQRVGSMGSTGRSTGPHLHYEVWENGSVRDPSRFFKAGDNVQQAQP